MITPTSLSRRDRWIAAAVLGAIAVLLNLFPLTLSPGIHWLFGGVAYLLIATVLGPWPGVIAAAAASLVTISLWHHPWAWVIFTLEGLVVALLVGRWRLRTLTAAAVYWLLVGVPLLLFFYRGLMGVGGTTLAIIALKQPLNGLVNAALAEVLLLVPVARRWLGIDTSPRLRSALSVLTFTAALLPALVFGAWAGRREWSRSLEMAETRAELIARSYASKLEQYVLLHSQSVRSLAQVIGSRNDMDPERLLRLLTGDFVEFPGFRSLAVLDLQGNTLVSHPSGVPDADSGILEALGLTGVAGAPPDSVVITGVQRVQGDIPTLFIVYPVLLAGETIGGYVLGSLHLSRLPAPITPPGDPEQIRVFDASGRLVVDAVEPYRLGDEPREVPERIAFDAVRSAGWSGTTVLRSESAVTAASRVAANVLVGHAPLESLGWWSWVEHPFTRIEAAVAAPFARLLGLLSVFLLFAAVLSTVAAGWMAAPLLRLRWAAAALASGQRDVRVRRLPAGAPRELVELAAGFDEMADALAGRAEELEELSEITQSLASTLEKAPLLQHITDAAARLVRAEGCGLALLGTEHGELRADEYSLGLLEPVAGLEIPSRDSLVGWVVENARPARVSRVHPTLTLYSPDVSLERVGSFIAAPMIGRSGALGALVAVRSNEAEPFSADNLQLLERLARTAAIAVENARLIEAARAASRAKSDFIAAMSHELRTPLNAVLGHLQLLDLELHGPLQPKQREALGRIGTATRHLSGLIEEVLSFARLEAGRASVDIEPTDVVELVQEVAAVIESLAEQKNLRFTIDLPLPESCVDTDPDKVRQILINLAGNAVKFTEVGEVSLSVEHRSSGAAEGQVPDAVIVRVADTGPGIASSDRPRLFRPFEQLDSGLARRYGGTGLGLYLSAQYAALIGGTIEVESEPGRGSVFSLVLPAARQPVKGGAEEIAGQSAAGR